MDPKDRWKHFGAWLRKEREAARRSQKEIASLTELHPVHISRIETGDTGIKLKTLDALIKALDLDAEEAYKQAGFWPATTSSIASAAEAATFGEKMERLIAVFNSFSQADRQRALKTLTIVYGATAEIAIVEQASDLNKKDYEEVEPAMARKIDL